MMPRLHTSSVTAEVSLCSHPHVGLANTWAPVDNSESSEQAEKRCCRKELCVSHGLLCTSKAILLPPGTVKDAVPSAALLECKSTACPINFCMWDGMAVDGWGAILTFAPGSKMSWATSSYPWRSEHRNSKGQTVWHSEQMLWGCIRSLPTSWWSLKAIRRSLWLC